MLALDLSNNVSQACQKCDEGSPCSFCTENSIRCEYRESPALKYMTMSTIYALIGLTLFKVDKNMEILLSYIRDLSQKIDHFGAQLGLLKQDNQHLHPSNMANRSTPSIAAVEAADRGKELHRFIRTHLQRSATARNGCQVL